MIGRIAIFTYGMVCYVAGMAALAYMALWMIELVPNALDSPTQVAWQQALATNLGLILLFGLQHSGMARGAFKKWLTRWLPEPMERPTYVLASALVLGLLMVAWQPVGVTLWRIDTQPYLAIFYLAYGAAWLLLVSATFCVDHFDLFGLRQVWRHLRDLPAQQHGFMVRGLYRLVRHPIYLGWFLVIWIAPVMTISHLLFAIGTTVYTLWAVRLEERDLLASLPEYAEYRRTHPMVLPRVARRAHDSVQGPAATSGPATY